MATSLAGKPEGARPYTPRIYLDGVQVGYVFTDIFGKKVYKKTFKEAIMVQRDLSVVEATAILKEWNKAPGSARYDLWLHC